MAAISSTLSVFANCQCNIVKPNALSDLGDIFSYVPSSVRLWCYESSSNHTGSDNDGIFNDFDSGVESEFRAARVLGTMALCLGWLILLFTIADANERHVIAVAISPVAAWRVCGVLAFCTGILQALVVFLVFRSNVCALGCDLDNVGKCAICAVP